GARSRTAGEPGMRAGQRGAFAVAQRQEIEQGRIAQLRGTDVAERARDGLDAAGRLALPLRHHLLHLLALQVFLRTAQVAGNDRERLRDRKSTRLNSSHVKISYAVFCLKKKKHIMTTNSE